MGASQLRRSEAEWVVARTVLRFPTTHYPTGSSHSVEFLESSCVAVHLSCGEGGYELTSVLCVRDAVESRAPT